MAFLFLNAKRKFSYNIYRKLHLFDCIYKIQHYYCNINIYIIALLLYVLVLYIIKCEQNDKEKKKRTNKPNDPVRIQLC